VKTFEYFKPTTVKEALELLREYNGKVALLAGGTDLAVMIDDGMVVPDYVIDVKGIEELSGISLEQDYLRIGSLVTFSEILHSDLVKANVPVLFEAAKTVASVGVRNRATLVGNICSSVPSADSAPALLVLEALVEIEGKERRIVPVKEFFTGPRKNVLAKDEIVLSVKIPTEKESMEQTT